MISFLVSFSDGELAAVLAEISGDDVDLAVGDGVRIGEAGRGVNCFAGVALGAIDAGRSAGFDANGVGVEVSVALGVAVALNAVSGVGVALGTSNRPRRCDVVGETEAVEIGVDTADALAVGASVAAR